MLILNKKKIIVLTVLFIYIGMVFASSIKKNVDKRELFLKKQNQYVEEDLCDYLPHVDGVAIIYRDPDNIYKNYVSMQFFTSLYQEIYHLSFNESEISGYIEKITYSEPYVTDNAKTDLLEEFSGKIDSIITGNDKKAKYINLALELLNDHK